MTLQKQLRFVTIKDVTAELATSESQIRAIINSGELPAIQIGGRGYLKFRVVFAESFCA